VNGVVLGRKQRGPLLADPPAEFLPGLLAELLDVVRAVRPDADLGLIQRAFEVAAACHHGQRRRSGDPYITHPVSVAAILAGLGVDDELLCAALLHDTTEDTPYTLAELTRDFGANIADLVVGVVAMDRIKYSTARTLDQAIAAVQSADPRILVVSLADRLHNMRTLEFIPQEKQLRKARESLEFFAPVAARLSLRTIESELETLASATFRRHRYVGSASGRLLTAMTALLPGPAQTRWCEEWMGELHTFPTRRARARFAVHTVLGVPRLAVTLRRPSPAGRLGQ
jgi:GTP pyrophosphokinase